jgi:hypothetical protein
MSLYEFTDWSIWDQASSTPLPGRNPQRGRIGESDAFLLRRADGKFTSTSAELVGGQRPEGTA